MAKEKLLDPESNAKEHPVTILGKCSGLVGGTSPEAIAAAVVAALRLMERPQRQPEATPASDDDDDDDDTLPDEFEPEPEPEVATQALIDHVHQLRAQGLSRTTIADQLAISVGRVRYLETR